MKQYLIALVSGILFGLGLGISQMIDRNRVLGFLDVKGVWDPTLLFVLGGAVGVTIIAFRFVLKLPHPLFSDKFYLPKTQDIDLPLVIGAAIFGIGWGISGYCPGPGIAALVLGIWNPVLFLAAMLVGSLAQKSFSSATQARSQAKTYSDSQR
ncbi:YeeE/YedE family protein [Merismopedia glauca]|uniref:YeeE/YedE family protein n=1 Tax=Merismopedia glauca CCAP 1448/3 TaxID=1296344 RepID=A0A2T1BXF6_9CYAN|nr:YeeE/YedE family protein [Merismopedia glauca]PSB00696.1 YeeE/YedE family protein [Merismopedia glauca CCAP 1448/3]